MLTLHGKVLEVEAVPASEADLLRVHTAEYLDRVRCAVSRAESDGAIHRLTDDTPVSGASWEAAIAAAGTGISAIEGIHRGEAENAFCAARPPGRAALPDGAADFCILNNVAIAARCLTDGRGAQRILIVDWGAPSPPATAAIFARDPQVEVLSWGGQPDALAASVERVRPEWILLSATLGGDPEWTFRCTRDLRSCARAVCDGRLVSVLEGGYDAAALGANAVQHVRALAGLPPA